MPAEPRPTCPGCGTPNVTADKLICQNCIVWVDDEDVDGEA